MRTTSTRYGGACGLAVVAAAVGCSTAGGRDEFDGSGVDATATTTITDGTDGTSTGGTTQASATSGMATTTDDPIFDVGGGGADLGRLPPMCKVGDDMNAGGTCDEKAPPDSFSPDVQWEWAGQDTEIYVVVTPLVANMTDDNGDGEIDLCDVPDIVVVAWATIFGPGHIYVLDGETGTVHLKIATDVGATTTPALGDIDGDGIVEIVTALPDNRLVAFSHEGDVQWMSTATWAGAYIGGVALADMDNDDDVEIVVGNQIFDHLGQLAVTTGGTPPPYATTTAADMDADGDLEVVLGNSVFHHDGSQLWTTAVGAGFPQVADLDGDGLPEVLVTNSNGLSLIEHNGTVTYQDLRPTGDPAGANVWARPATIHDFDGDGQAEYAVSSSSNYSVYEADASILWSAPVLDSSGIAAGTAFDFLGDGDAEAMYGDETFMFVFDGMGNVLLQTPRTSRTGTEYPVVADVDNDGSAEIVVVSNEPISGGGATAPPVQVIRDVEDRWIQARRIWNQHTYHVTNVREDGTIPQFEPPSWELLNTFRTNAQIEGGGVCVPDPEG